MKNGITSNKKRIHLLSGFIKKFYADLNNKSKAGN
jgi:hypothetical protein